MEYTSFSDDLRRYMALMWHWGWLLVLAAVLAAASAYVVSKRMTPVYRASTSLLINEAPANKATDYTSLVTSERLARTYAELMTKRPVLEAIIDQLGLELDTRELGEAIDVQPVVDTQLIEVQVEHTNPVTAAAIANTLVTVFAEQNQSMQASRYAASKESLSEQMTQMDAQIEEATTALNDLGDSPADQAERDRLETNLAQYRQTYAGLLQSYEEVRVAEAQSTSNVVQAEPAAPPERPVRPRTLVNTLLAGMVGLMLAVGIVFMVEALDDTLRGPDDVARTLNLPVLGMIAQHDAEDGHPVTAFEPRSPVAEAFRSLRTNIQYASVDRPVRTLLVTSPSPAEGKSTVAANLSVVLAQSGREVALVDADLRKPRVHKALGVSNRSGISALFVQPQRGLDGSLQKTPTPHLSVLTSGALPPNPSELLGSEKMFDILRQVAERADIIVIDSPPVMAVTDSTVLAPRVDGVLLVLKPGVTKLAAARTAVEQLRRVGANLLGVVLNEIDVGNSRYSYYNRGYYQAYQEYYGDSAPQKSLRRKKPSV
jgi:capsular exopolysaccharide synthesis family protein